MKRSLTGVRWWLMALVLACAAMPALACPVCEGETRQQVRATLFGAGSGFHLLAATLPFAVLLGIVALIHGGPRNRTL